MTYLMESEFQQLAGGAFVDTKGTISDVLGQPLQGAEPNVKGIMQLTYQNGPYSIGWQTRYIDHMRAQNDDGSPALFGVVPYTPAYLIHRLTLGWSPAHFTVIGGIENIMNKQPPIYTTDVQAGIQANTDPSTFDMLGRRFYINASYKF